MSRTINKILAFKLATAIALLVSGFAFGADNVSVQVVMTLQNVSVARLSDGALNIKVSPGTSKVTDRSIYKNDGNVAVHFAIKIAGTNGNWTPVITVPGANQYRLSALWHQWDATPAVAEFQDNDFLTTDYQTSTDTKYFNDSETHLTDGVKGNNVQPDEERNLFIRLDAPASGTGSATAEVNVSAVAVP
ncbi:MAG: hypothetical protein A3I11_07585 [Elusimicrobia bacterium RIFCSPLOWO2_02_FULL_39_32]|nr:MAG: hypothetical protein UU09_C0003G0017 [Microgenomates group bacterium GW2011_GWA2_40_6]OGR81387.1 MAG: hypothetical protein A3B80_05040 [Elusimicrobia bacterium RIFCSPHIGHO2_02_FULL_39_36]OGR92046.1 MAG: hypothetical protein A3I11_07585 [Elusimicrobia bacterium RIFCSPLOWO2_02_FULL_39_32]OGR98663.1 MAG: hypothetical protein A3G85_04845 [Elusimicrobia bacterium RIFCSPLOWO2_12_FULL_39_28]